MFSDEGFLRICMAMEGHALSMIFT